MWGLGIVTVAHATPPASATRGRSLVIGRQLQSEQLFEIQRSRLIAGAIQAIDELGYVRATVGQITRCASVSRRTFYELFADREACLVAVLESVVGAIAAELAAADLERVAWRERVRAGLATILAFFDREPVLARVCVVQALRGGPDVLRRREAVLVGIAAAIDEGREEGPRGAGCTPLTAEGLVGAAFSIVYARLLRSKREPLTELLGELMAIIVLPYLGPAAARREQVRRAPAELLGQRDERNQGENCVGGGDDPLRGVPLRLTYRTARVLECVAERPGESNRMIAEDAGVSDAGQISKLLARLERVGLLANTSLGHARGEPNAWRLTPKGVEVAHSIGVHTRRWREAA